MLMCSCYDLVSRREKSGHEKRYLLLLYCVRQYDWRKTVRRKKDQQRGLVRMQL